MTSPGLGACRTVARRTVALIVTSFADVVGGAPPAFRALSVSGADGRAPRSHVP
jgi:hypothetical protein